MRLASVLGAGGLTAHLPVVPLGAQDAPLESLALDLLLRCPAERSGGSLLHRQVSVPQDTRPVRHGLSVRF